MCDEKPVEPILVPASPFDRKMAEECKTYGTKTGTGGCAEKAKEIENCV